MKRLCIGIILFFLIFPVLAQEENRKDFAKDYERLMKSDSNNIEAHRAFITKWKLQTTELESLYKRLVADSPNNATYQYSLGYVYASTSKDEDIDRSIAYFAKSQTYYCLFQSWRNVSSKRRL